MKRIFVALLLLAAGAAWATVPTCMTFQGVFQDAEGNLMPDGMYEVGFHIFAGPVGGPPTWSEWDSIEVVDGVFSVNLGGVFPLLPNLFPKAGVWLGLSYDEEFLEPRQPFCSVPYAIRSSVTAHSDSLGNLTETSINNRFTAVENRVGSNEDDIEDLEVDIGSFEDGIGDLEDSVAVHRDNIDELYTLVGGEDACCPLEMYVDGSFVDIVVSRGALTIINTGTFTLGCESPVQFYGSIGMPILPLPEGGQSVYMTVNLMDDSNTLVQNSQLVGGTAFISYRALTIATPVNPGTYYLRITIGYNADEGADDIVFDGWEAGAIYQECPAIPGR